MTGVVSSEQESQAIADKVYERMIPRKVLAHVLSDAGSGSVIDCMIKEKEKVHCIISGGENLNEAVPRLRKGDIIIVEDINGRWYSNQHYQASVDCDCVI